MSEDCQRANFTVHAALTVSCFTEWVQELRITSKKKYTL